MLIADFLTLEDAREMIEMPQVLTTRRAHTGDSDSKGLGLVCKDWLVARNAMQSRILSNLIYSYLTSKNLPQGSHLSMLIKLDVTIHWSYLVEWHKLDVFQIFVGSLRVFQEPPPQHSS